MKAEPNHSINPILDSHGNGSFKGLTKREYFAAMALQGLLSNAGFYQSSADTFAKASVEHADALITALNKQS